MDNKIIKNYRHTEEYQALVRDIAASLTEEAKTRVANSKEESLRRLRARHEMAEEITNHPVYQKWGKGNQAFIENFRKDVKREIGDKVERIIGKSSLYDALQVFSKFPTEKKLLEELDKRNLPYSWSSALQLLNRDSQRSAQKIVSGCRKCPLHCPHKVINYA